MAIKINPLITRNKYNPKMKDIKEEDNYNEAFNNAINEDTGLSYADEFFLNVFARIFKMIKTNEKANTKIKNAIPRIE